MAPGDSTTPTATALADQFGRTAKRLARAFDDALAGHGVTTPRARVLMHVAEHGPTRLTGVAVDVGVAQGTASELMEALVREGLVVRTVDPTDRRATLLTASERGAAEARDWRARYEAAADELFTALSGPDRTALVELLRKVDGER